jgi:hypothetical protein
MSKEHWMRQVAGAVIGAFAALSLTSGAQAVDLTGYNIATSATTASTYRNSVSSTVTWNVQIYFGSKGNRFVKIDAVRGGQPLKFAGNRILIPAGETRGSQRRKDGLFLYVIKLTESGNSLQIFWDSRGKDTRYANETTVFTLSLSTGSCRLDNFRYNADARMQLQKVTTTKGDCKVTRGLPADMSSEN